MDKQTRVRSQNNKTTMRSKNSGSCKFNSLVILIIFTIFAIGLYSFRSLPLGETLDRYELQQNYLKYTAASESYNLILASDLDKQSKEGNVWKSILLYAKLTRDASGQYSVSMIRNRTVTSGFNDGSRGMELSDICNYNGKLYTFDDRTGLVFIIEEDNFYPIHILSDGNGAVSKGFKGEWCTVKDGLLYIGGMGKEWTDSEGNFVTNDPLWVKTIDRSGTVTHLNWTSEYANLRKALQINPPGYLLNEAVVWRPSAENWVFLPRRVSYEKYNDVLDEYRCSNTAIVSNSDVSTAKAIKDIGPLVQTRGFSSAKYIPWRENEIVVLKTDEVGQVTTYMMVFDIVTKKILMPDTKISELKLEGLEFL